MEISVSKRTNTRHEEKPEIGEILVQIKGPKKVVTRIELNEQEFDDVLEEYVDKAENFGDFDMQLEERILSYGVSDKVFNEMRKELEMLNTNEYATDISSDDEYPAFTGFINFPWKEWKEKLLTIYKE